MKVGCTTVNSQSIESMTMILVSDSSGRPLKTLAISCQHYAARGLVVNCDEKTHLRIVSVCSLNASVLLLFLRALNPSGLRKAGHEVLVYLPFKQRRKK